MPDATPRDSSLQKETSKNIVRDQLPGKATPFMFGLTKDVCQLLQVWTSVYHTQTDGLVKHFNQTLKRLLR